MRLKWIMYVENMMSDVGNRLMIYYEKMKRLRRKLDVIQQIHLSPQMYISAVEEVVRRRTFSQAFLLVSYVTYMFIISILHFRVVCLNQFI
jgi:RB1-inducible coiled-coil protein 1